MDYENEIRTCTNRLFPHPHLHLIVASSSAPSRRQLLLIGSWQSITPPRSATLRTALLALHNNARASDTDANSHTLAIVNSDAQTRARRPDAVARSWFGSLSLYLAGTRREAGHGKACEGKALSWLASYQSMRYAGRLLPRVV
jgi:hypothetical protein